MNKEEEILLSTVASCEPTIVPFLLKQLVARVGPDVVRSAFHKALPATDSVDDGPLFMQVADFLRYVGEIPPLLVDTLIPEKSLVLVTGKPKAGKSHMAVDMGEAISEGRDVFGSFTVNRPGPVGYIGMEDGETEIAKRLYDRGFELQDSQRRIHICHRRFKINDTRNMDKVKEFVDTIQPVLLIVDTARESLGIADWNQSAQVSDAIRPLREFARNNCSIILVAHNKKGLSEDDGDEISGSNALASSVDGWISARSFETMPNGNRRIFLSVNGRGGMEGKPVVEMDTNTLHFRLVPSDELGGEAAAHERASKQRKWAPFLDALERFPQQTATVVAWSEAMQTDRKNVDRIIKELVTAGEIHLLPSTQKGDAAGRPAAQYKRSIF